MIPYAAMAQARQPAAVEEVVVTGSRIERAGFDTLEPATTVDSAYLENRGTTNIGDALRETPSFGPGQTPEGNQGSYATGQTYVDRFALGSARTLTVVNGRRFVSTNAPSAQGNQTGSNAPAGLQVDLNAIPSIMIDRVDNLSIGGAPAYGSDAIAGVVNIILKKKYQGLKVTAQTGITAKGDNFRANLAGLAGMNFAEDRGNVMVAASYDRSDGVRGARRARDAAGYGYQSNPTATSAAANIPGRTPANDGRVNTSIPFNTGNTDGIPNSVLIANTRLAGITPGGVLMNAAGTFGADFRVTGFGPNNQRLQFADNGNLVPYDPGSPFSTTFASGGDGWAFYLADALLADVERYSANLNATYDVNENMQLFVESSYYRGLGRELADQGPYNSPLFGNRTISTGALLFSATDPRLTQQARDLLSSYGVTQFSLSRVGLDLANNKSRSQNEVYRVVGGLTDKLNILDRDFKLEASLNYGQTNGNYYVTELVQQHLVNALNVKLDSAGKLVCDAAPAFNVSPGPLSPVADSACVPLDVFGNGRRSQAAYDYVTKLTHSRSRLEQTIASVNLSTPELFRIWAGPVGFSLGAEARKEFGAFNPDPLDAAGGTRFAPIAAVRGSFNTKEAFGELVVPLVSPDNNIPLIHSLEAEGRWRYVDNSVNGGFWTYTGGGRYQPFQDLTLRGNYTRSLRAPSVLELFMPEGATTATFPDPCHTANLTAGTAPAIRQANCAAFYKAYGIDGTNFISSANNATVPQRIGGNPNLQNESSDAYTLGFIYNPGFFSRLSVAVDWNRIKVNGNIVSLSASAIAQGCYDNPSFNVADVDNGNSFCSLFKREKGGARNGQIVADPLNPGVTTSYINGGFINFKALTTSVNLRDIDFVWDTKLSLNGNFYYLDKFCRSDNLITTTCSQGTTTSPRWTTQFGGVLAKGPFSLFAEVNYRPSTKYDLTFNQESRDILSIGHFMTVNSSIAYNNDEKGLSLRFAVNNLFNAIPPFPSQVGDMLGRRFTLSVGKSF
jgi:outer membrane receptor protein involved in Fe transport